MEHTRSVWRLWLWSGVLAVCLLASAPASAQRLSLRTSADSVAIGERFSLTILAEHGGTATPLFPDPARGDSTLGDLLLLQRLSTGSRDAEGTSPGARIDSAVYEVTTFALDTAYVPPTPIPFTTDGDTLSATTLAFFIPVTSIVPQNAENIRDLAPLVEFGRPWWFWALVALAILAAAAIAWYLWQRRRKRLNAAALAVPARHASPYEEAMERLHHLEVADLTCPEHVKPFYVELSDLLRTYLSRELGVPALEETTRELMLELSRRSQQEHFPPSTITHISHVLELADLVKFADMQPGTATTRDALNETCTIVQQIETALHPAPALGEPTEQPAEMT